MHPSGVAKSTTSFAGVKVEISPEHVTLCDRIWHVSSHSGEASCKLANCCTVLRLRYLLLRSLHQLSFFIFCYFYFIFGIFIFQCILYALYIALLNLCCYCGKQTYTHLLSGPFSGTTQVSQYQKGKTNLDFSEARDSESQWHQLSHMQVCTSLQIDNHTSTPSLCFLQAECPSCHPTNRVKALKAIVANKLHR